MKVAVETNALYTSRAGVARSVRSQLLGLERTQRKGDEVRTLAWERGNFGYRQPRRALRTLYRELLWARWPARRELAREEIDLHHATHGWLVRPPAGTRHVATLHDLAVLRYPERFRRWHRRSATARLRRLHEVDRVVCVSRFTADEAMRMLALPADRLEVVPNGSWLADSPPGDRRPASLPAEVEASGFVVFVGTLEPGKNLELMAEVYARAADAGRRLPPLVVSGEPWAGVGGLADRPPDWHFLGYRDDAELVWLYRRARAQVFPTRYEGFGYPLLEGMALGCPTVASRVASLPELAGDGALMAPPEPEPFGEALRTLLRDDAARDDIVRAGREQARRFSCARMGEDLWRLYREVAG